MASVSLIGFFVYLALLGLIFFRAAHMVTRAVELIQQAVHAHRLGLSLMTRNASSAPAKQSVISKATR